jgi:hypothetical protein
MGQQQFVEVSMVYILLKANSPTRIVIIIGGVSTSYGVIRINKLKCMINK